MKQTGELISQYKRSGVPCANMLASTFFVVAQLRRTESAAILAIPDNILTKEVGLESQEFRIAEKLIIEIALRAILKAHSSKDDPKESRI